MFGIAFQSRPQKSPAAEIAVAQSRDFAAAAELAARLAADVSERSEDGGSPPVRHGDRPGRTVMTGIDAKTSIPKLLRASRDGTVPPVKTSKRREGGSMFATRQAGPVAARAGAAGYNRQGGRITCPRALCRATERGDLA